MLSDSRTVSGAAIAKVLLTLALGALGAVSLVTHEPNDWFALRRAASEGGLRAVLYTEVENHCGLLGAAVAHLVRWALGSVAGWSIVGLLVLGGIAPVWPALRRRLWYWCLMLMGFGLALAAASARWPRWTTGLHAGGRIGVGLNTLGERTIGPTGTSVFLILALLLLPFHAAGGFSRRVRVPSLPRMSPRRLRRARPKTRPVAPPDTGQPEVPVQPVVPSVQEEPRVQEPQPAQVALDSWPFRLPPLSLLRSDGPMQPFVDPKEIERRKQKLEEALGSFGVTAKVVRAVPGPVITRFEVEPAPGVKVSRIESLADDISLALKALQTRVVAPIPGTGVVGIEVPNRKAAIVRLGDLMQAPVFSSSSSPLLLAVGRDSVGEPVACDLSTLPHLLIGGTTGSGKSSCINSFICGLLMRVTPHMVRFLLIDPKRVELTAYEGIPHLLYPVVTDPKVALKTLTWTANEMERRYEFLSGKGVRDIGEFHASEPERASEMPYVVVVIDELADLMMSAPAEMEAVIIRIAQKARAVGIHLIVATQRPSKEIVTGVLKSNFPGRIAFQVMQRVNSNIILDSPGAERLLGKGDMLFLPPGAPGPQRVHGAFITQDEVRALVEFWRAQSPAGEASPAVAATEPPPVGAPGLAPSFFGAQPDEEAGEGEDPLWEDAARVVILNRLGSTSLLQRRLKVGYARAGRLMDILEAKGVVGPAQGSKPRDVLVDATWLEHCTGEGER